MKSKSVMLFIGILLIIIAIFASPFLLFQEAYMLLLALLAIGGFLIVLALLNKYAKHKRTWLNVVISIIIAIIFSFLMIYILLAINTLLFGFY